MLKILYLLLAAPILGLIYSAYGAIDKKWLLLTIPQVKNTLILLLAVLPISLILGFIIAYILTMYKIPFKKIIKNLYIYSMILPAYILAILYSDISTLLFSKVGLILILILSTLPFSVIAFRNGIKSQSQVYLSLSENLGLSKFTYLFRILIPLLKPTILFTSFIIMAEIISEFGATYYLGQHTLMTGIYDIRFVAYKTYTGAQLSLFFILIFILFIFLFKFKYIYANPGTYNNKIIKKDTKYKYLLSIIVSLPLIFTLFIPVYIFSKWTYLSYYKMNFENYLHVLENTIILGIITGIIAVIFSIVLSYIKKNNLLNFIINILYVLPGLIISISILTITPFVSGYILNYITLVYGLGVKFLTLGYHIISNNLLKIDSNLLKLSLSFGKSKIWHFFNIDFFIIKKSVLLSFLLIFLEVIRELPITMTLAPFGFKTISMHIFFAINAERLYFAGPYILTLFIIILITNIIINKTNKNYIN